MPISTTPSQNLFDDAARFERRADGRTVFYTTSKRIVGYVIDTPERERSLRTYVRGELLQLVLVAPLACPMLLGVAYLSALYPEWTVPSWITAMGVMAAYVAWHYRRMKRLVNGLEKVVAPGYTPRFFWSRRIATAFVVLLALGLSGYFSYRPGAAVSLPANAVAFYSDITFPLFVTLLFACVWFLLVDNRKAIIRERGSYKYLGLISMFSIFVLALTGWTLGVYFTTSPEILITPTSLSCKPFQLRWSAVSDIRLVSSGTVTESATLTLDPAQLSTLTLRPADIDRGTVSCRVTGKTVGYRAIYDEIYRTWQEARARS